MKRTGDGEVVDTVLLKMLDGVVVRSDVRVSRAGWNVYWRVGTEGKICG